MQDINTGEQYPTGEEKTRLADRTREKQEEQRHEVGDHGQPAWHHYRSAPNRADREHIYPGNAQDIVAQDLIHKHKAKDKNIFVGQLVCSQGKTTKYRPSGGSPNKRKDDVSDAAPQKYCGEESVFPVADMIADHTRKPEKSDPSKRYQPQCQGDGIHPGFNPIGADFGRGHLSDTGDQQHAGDQQTRKKDPGKCS